MKITIKVKVYILRILSKWETTTNYFAVKILLIKCCSILPVPCACGSHPGGDHLQQGRGSIGGEQGDNTWEINYSLLTGALWSISLVPTT